MTTDNDFLKYLRQHAEGEPETILEFPVIPRPILDVDPEILKKFNRLEKKAKSCTACRLSEKRQNVVFGMGNINADLMFIGEGPGADEDRQGLPFVGRAGKLLDKILDAMKLKRSEVFIANVVKCRPPGNRDPHLDEAETCIPYLKEQIELINPSVLVALGKVAAVHLLGLKPDVSVKSVRERIHNYQGKPLIVTYHPAALLRSQDYKRPTWEDMKLVMKILSGELKWSPQPD